MAITAQQFLERVDEVFGDRGSETVVRQWVHPFLRLAIRSELFDGLEPDEREQRFAEKLRLDVANLRALSARTFVRWELLGTAEDGVSVPQMGAAWLELLDPGFSARDPHPGEKDGAPRFVHFYGYKGGQGRTTVLACLARILAEDGWKVLAVDFDAEAPSLDIILGARATSPSSSVLGFRLGDDAATPVELGVTARGGQVSVLPFRPEPEGFDFDAAALAFELQSYAAAAVHLSERLKKLVDRDGYDVVLVDHRTGLGPVVPVLVRDLPGPIVVCSRLDGQSKYARRAVEGLWAIAGHHAGALVSLSPPEETDDEFRRRRRGEAEDFLASLGRAKEGIENADPQDFVGHWIVWPFDLDLARRLDLPTAGMSGIQRQQIESLRRIVELEGSKAPAMVHKSGAIDEGDLIVTQALRRLMARNSPYTLVVGRKGTGKTRIVRALAEHGLGEPLLVPSDFSSKLGGIRAQNIRLKRVIAKFRDEPDLFWYVLIVARLREIGRAGGDPLDAVEHLVQELGSDRGRVLDILLETIPSLSGRTTLLVDALESAFDKKSTFPFVRGLFHVLEAIDATPEFSAAVGLRLFVRRDLVEHGIQNREQIEAGRRINLFWDTQTIYNFVLSRLKERPWFEDQFPDVVHDIRRHATQIHEGQVSEDDCEKFLFRIFPKKLSYKNMLTATFFRTYFSDDGGGGTSYYPRVYMVFLEQVEELSKNRRLVDGKIDGTVVVKAHENASAAFLEEVSQELAHAADIEPPTLRKMLSALDGERTPFDVDQLAKQVARSAKVKQDQVREVFDTMKQLGVFEDYPKRPNQWRPGRLFKTALKMRFQAGKR